MTTPNQQESRGVIVTGARTGIGLEIALAFLRKGDRVVLSSRKIDLNTLQENKDEIERFVQQKQAFLLQKDVTDPQECKELVKAAADALGGKLDVLVNNAGGGQAMIPFEEISAEVWRDHLAVNLDSVFYLTQAAVPYLKKTKGNIVNISSTGGFRPVNAMMAYCVAKAGVDMLTRATALEYASEGVRINSVNPGVVKTPFFEHTGLDKEQEADMLKSASESYPIGRVGLPSDVASLTVFLADNAAAAWLTGQNIALDGGKLIAQ